MTVIEVKDIKLKKGGKIRTIRMTIEDVETKKEYSFDIGVEDLMDEIAFKNILNMWADYIIPREKARATLKDNEIEDVLKKRIGLKSKKNN